MLASKICTKVLSMTSILDEVISAFRSFAPPQADGELKNDRFRIQDSGFDLLSTLIVKKL